MRPSGIPRVLLLIAFAAGCGGGEETITIRGDFAGEAAPALVRAVEAGREAAVSDGVFELTGLVAAPVSLRLVQDGDTVGRLDLPDVPTGATVTLEGLRIDPESRRAFPARVAVDGGGVISLNGIRVGGSVPGEVDVRGAVLAVTDSADALLFRPDDAALPDLRVFVSIGTETVTSGGARASPSSLSPGDSLRLEGRTDRGIVLATRLTVPDALADEQSAMSDLPVEDGGSGGGGSGGDGDRGGAPAVASSSSGSGGGGASPAPVVFSPPRLPSAPVVRTGRGNDDPGRGRGNDKGRGNKKGWGNDEGRGNGKGKDRG